MPHFNDYNPGAWGWQVSHDIVPYIYKGVSFPGGVNKNVVFLFNRLLDQLVPHIPGGLDKGACWGYENRAIVGGVTTSFHAYGLAIDINAPENPYRGDGTPGPHAMPDIANTIARSLGMEWGGSWESPKDYMHFEVHLTPAEVASMVKSTPTPAKITYSAYAHGMAPGKRTVRVGSAGDDVKYVQRWIGNLTVDGYFGTATEAQVKWYQHMRGITVDGIVGPVTWRNMSVKT